MITFVALACIFIAFLGFAAFLATFIGAGIVRAEQERFDRDLMYSTESEEVGSMLQARAEPRRAATLTPAYAHR